MGRKLKTRIPTLPQNLRPQQPEHNAIHQADKAAKAQYKAQYDRRHRARQLPALQPQQSLMVKLDSDKHWSQPGTVTLADPVNRSYQVTTPSSTIHHNRKHLQAVPPPTPADHILPAASTPPPLALMSPPARPPVQLATAAPAVP